jgi:hypothetical protein
MANLDELHAEAVAHRNSTAFDRLKEYNLARIEGYRDQLERVEEPNKVWVLKGRIKECREQLKILSE